MGTEEAKSVALTELEYHKLLRFSEQVASTEAQAELLLTQVKAKIAEVRSKRESYFNELVSKYPDLKADVNYTPEEATFTLLPQSS